MGPQAHPFDHKTVTNRPIQSNSDPGFVHKITLRGAAAQGLSEIQSIHPLSIARGDPRQVFGATFYQFSDGPLRCTA